MSITGFAILFFAAAIIASTCFGLFAVSIFTGLNVKTLTWSQWIHSIWFNFLGSLVGWIALWVLVRRHCDWFVNSLTSPTLPPHPAPTVWDVLASAVAFIGITGFLPYTVVGAIEAIKRLGEKAVTSLVGKKDE